MTETTFTIETPRLRLVCCDKEILNALFVGNEALSKKLGTNVPDKWTDFGEPAYRWTYDALNKPGSKQQWWSYLPIWKEANTLIGGGGYKGEPKDGMVETGYEIAEAFRRKGFATEMADALIHHAFGYSDVVKVQAHTLAEKNESGTVLQKCGMQKVEEVEDPDDGKVWRWEIVR